MHTGYRFFDTSRTKSKKKKEKTREYAHIHEDAPHTSKNIDENSATVGKETTTKEERNEKRFEVDRDRKRSCWSRT